MKRIIIHWTAGAYKAGSLDRDCYHYMIQGNGVIVNGVYKPEDNLCCTDGRYAKHTAQGNTGSIGVAYCGMHSYKSPESLGNSPLTRSQMEAGFKFIAELCKKYAIPVTPLTVLTHYEFDRDRGCKGRKIDITCIPYEKELGPDEVGDYIRNKIKWYLLKM